METAAISLHRLRLWVIVTYGSIGKPSDSFSGVVGAAGSHSGHRAFPMETKLGSWSCSRRKWTCHHTGNEMEELQVLCRN